MQTVEGHEGTEFDNLFSPYWNILLWMRRTALEKAMTLLTPPPSGGPAGKHTHVPVFHRRCDLNSGPVPKA